MAIIINLKDMLVNQSRPYFMSNLQLETAFV